MYLIKTIIINDPPTKYIKKVTKRKKRPDGTKKEGLEDVYYLTGNLFYSSDTHFSVRSEIVYFMKYFLLEHFQGLPKLEKMRLFITYQRTTDNFDLDNKVYFWKKIILDLLKTPSQKEVARAKKYKRDIVTLNIIKDDSCKYVDECREKYQKGVHLMKIEIYGRLLNEQKTLF